MTTAYKIIGDSGVGGGGSFTASGDLSGDETIQTVIGIDGNPVDAASPSEDDVLTWDGSAWVPSAPASGFTAGGDLAGNASSQTVIGIDGNPVDAESPNENDVLTWDGSAWVPSAPASGFTAGGDLSGTSSSQSVIAIRGKTLATALASVGATQDGYALTYVHGSAEWQAKPIVAGNTFTAGGDLSGNETSQTVIGIDGNPVDASNPSTNDVLTWDGSAWVPSAPASGFTAGGDLSGNSTSQTVIAIRGKSLASALASVGATQDGYALTYVHASSEWQAKPVSGGGGLTVAGSASEIQINDGSSGLGAATNVKAGTDYISIGASDVASSGALRLPTSTDGVVFRNPANTADIVALSGGSSNQLFIGGSSSGSNRASFTVIDATTSITGRISGSTKLSVTSSLTSTNNNVAIGSGTSASVGTIRLPANGTIYGRNSADNGDLSLLSLNGFNTLYIGQNPSTATDQVQITAINGLNDVLLRTGGTTRVEVSTSAVSVYHRFLQFANSVVAPFIRQTNDATNGVTGDALTIQAQNCTGTTSTGGDLILSPGTGTSANGNINLDNVPTGTATESGVGGADALPETPTGYLTIKINGTLRQIAYY